MAEAGPARAVPAKQIAHAPIPVAAARGPVRVGAAKLIIGAMLALKVGVTAWNASAYEATGYDPKHHQRRAAVGGLEPGKMYYDGPLYYVPALAFRAAAQRELAAESKPSAKVARSARAKRKAAEAEQVRLGAKLVPVLRATNVLYAAIFYLCWVCISFPRLMPDVRSWFAASALLLALPGYQKLGAMTHADNLFVASSAVCAAIWVVLQRRSEQGVPVDRGWWLGLPLAAGAIGLSRPFAAVPVVLFSAVACLHVWRARRPWSAAALARVAVALAIAGTISASWYVYRWSEAGVITDAHDKGYVARFAPYREGFDFVTYFSTFRLGDLLRTPNRLADPETGPSNEPRVANSFFTLLYSETWGDHWLYFSGPIGVDSKVWAKRVLFTAALPLPLLLVVGFVRSLRSAFARGRAAVPAPAPVLGRAAALATALEREWVVFAWLAAGVGLYLYWQTGAALLPGKNSTVKFTYTATFYPLVIALASWWRPSTGWFRAYATYLIVLFVLALPVAVFVPG